MSIPVAFDIKTEQYVDDSAIVGASLTVDPAFAFGGFTDFTANDFLAPTGVWTLDNGDGTYDLSFAAKGPAYSTTELPAQSRLVGFNIQVGGGDTVNLTGSSATYNASQNQLSSPDAGDLAAVWTWAGLTNGSGYPLTELSFYSVILTIDDSTGVEYNCECDEESNNENLGQLRTRMLVRLGYAAQAANPPPGMALLLDDFLRSAQRFLYGRYHALRTERFFTWTMEEGVRLYDLPDNDDTCTKELDPYRLTWVGVEDSNGVWTPLIKGIPPTFYTGVMNNGIPERYEIRQCIEVFPAPVEGYKLRIKGHFGLTSFTEDEDQTTIDSELVFLWALGSAKAHYGQPDAATVKSEANVMLGNLVAGTHQTARYVPNTWQIPPMTRPLFTGLDP